MVFTSTYHLKKIQYHILRLQMGSTTFKEGEMKQSWAFWSTGVMAIQNSNIIITQK